MVQRDDYGQRTCYGTELGTARVSGTTRKSVVLRDCTVVATTVLTDCTVVQLFCTGCCTCARCTSSCYNRVLDPPKLGTCTAISAVHMLLLFCAVQRSRSRSRSLRCYFYDVLC